MHNTREIQTALAALGFYKAKIDGLAGPITRSAIAAFQLANGLVADGIAGPLTQAKLFPKIPVVIDDKGQGGLDYPFLFAETKDKLFAKKFRDAQVSGVRRIASTFENAGYTDLDQLAYILATVYHETGPRSDPLHFAPRTEKYNPPAQAYFAGKYDPGTPAGKNLGNIIAGDGYRFRGRGDVQITGRRNYQFASDQLGINFTSNPDLALDPENSAMICVQGMMHGWFTGAKLSQFCGPGISPPNFYDARTVVNGHDDASLIAGYARDFRAALRRAMPNATGPVATTGVASVSPQIVDPMATGPVILDQPLILEPTAGGGFNPKPIAPAPAVEASPDHPGFLAAVAAWLAEIWGR